MDKLKMGETAVQTCEECKVPILWNDENEGYCPKCLARYENHGRTDGDIHYVPITDYLAEIGPVVIKEPR